MYGSEFVAARTCVKRSIEYRTTFWYYILVFQFARRPLCLEITSQLWIAPPFHTPSCTSITKPCPFMGEPNTTSIYICCARYLTRTCVQIAECWLSSEGISQYGSWLFLRSCTAWLRSDIFASVCPWTRRSWCSAFCARAESIVLHALQQVGKSKLPFSSLQKPTEAEHVSCLPATAAVATPKSELKINYSVVARTLLCCDTRRKENPISHLPIEGWALNDVLIS